MIIFHNCEKNRHKFEARYDTKPDSSISNLKGGWMSVEELERLTTIRTYIHDICVICGDTINREQVVHQEDWFKRMTEKLDKKQEV